MERLDSKYFERVIASIKEYRDKQPIVMRDDFRVALRARLAERAVVMVQEPEKAGWADFILRNKVFFGGAPVFAALAIVAMAALNHQIPVNNDQLIVETPKSTTLLGTENGNNQVGERGIGKGDVSDTMYTSSVLVTFSADSVMPPAEVLAARERFLRGEDLTGMTDVGTINLENGAQNIGYAFFNGLNTVLQFPVPVSGADQVLSSPAVQEQTSELGGGGTASSSQAYIVTSGADLFSNLIKNGQTMPQTVYEIPIEGSGKISTPSASGVTQDNVTKAVPLNIPDEANGTVISEKNSQEGSSQEATLSKTSPASQPVVVPASSSNDLVNNGVSDVNPVVVSPASTPAGAASDESSGSEISGQLQTRSLTTSVVLPSGEITVVETKSTDYLLPSETQNFVLPKSNLQYSLSDGLAIQTLDAGRIYYDGANREQVVAVVMSSWKNRVGSLSGDYYINVVKYPDGTYRATLYQYGKATGLLVISEAGGSLKTVTEMEF